MKCTTLFYIAIVNVLICSCTFISTEIINVQKGNEVEKDRIVNGTEAERHAYPFMVRLIVWWDDFNGMCGGTLINSQYVMTAAHCVFHPSKGTVISSATIYLGEHNRLSEQENRTILSGIQVFVNKYSKKQHYNDIALIQLSQPVNFSSEISPACIAKRHSEYVGSKATAIGWGALGSGIGISEVLREVELPILPDGICTKSYKERYYPNVMVCAGYTNATKDTCQGDSGGPLFIRKENQFITLGMTSFGNGCASEGYPGVYTRISTFEEWVVKIASSGGEICVK